MVDTNGIGFGSGFWMHEKYSLLVQVFGLQGWVASIRVKGTQTNIHMMKPIMQSSLEAQMILTWEYQAYELTRKKYNGIIYLHAIPSFLLKPQSIVATDQLSVFQNQVD